MVIQEDDARHKRVRLLGLAFWAGPDDVRLSPAARVAEIHLGTGATVVARSDGWSSGDPGHDSARPRPHGADDRANES
jgi:UDP-N-acetyl-D-mannosaminuronate dehydrogenase